MTTSLNIEIQTLMLISNRGMVDSASTFGVEGQHYGQCIIIEMLSFITDVPNLRSRNEERKHTNNRLPSSSLRLLEGTDCLRVA